MRHLGAQRLLAARAGGIPLQPLNTARARPPNPLLTASCGSPPNPPASPDPQ
jgi:hypothetical protein